MLAGKATLIFAFILVAFIFVDAFIPTPCFTFLVFTRWRTILAGKGTFPFAIPPVASILLDTVVFAPYFRFLVFALSFDSKYSQEV